MTDQKPRDAKGKETLRALLWTTCRSMLQRVIPRLNAMVVAKALSLASRLAAPVGCGSHYGGSTWSVTENDGKLSSDHHRLACHPEQLFPGRP